MFTRKRVCAFIASSLTIAGGTYSLMFWGWKVWLGILAGLVVLRLTAWAEGFEDGREQGLKERRW